MLFDCCGEVAQQARFEPGTFSSILQSYKHIRGMNEGVCFYGQETRGSTFFCPILKLSFAKKNIYISKVVNGPSRFQLFQLFSESKKNRVLVNRPWTLRISSSTITALILLILLILYCCTSGALILVVLCRAL